MSINKVLLMGNVGKDPDYKEVQGKPLAKFSLATSWGYGEKQKTQWHNIVVWGKPAEFVGRNVQKGTTLFVEGRLETNQWTDKNGTKHYKNDIVASQVVLLKGGTPKEDQGQPPQEEGAPYGGGVDGGGEEPPF